MRKCPSCKRSTFDTAKFCHHCGTRMINETIDCPSCGAENDIDAKNCSQCGHAFFEETPPPPPPSIEPKPKKKPIPIAPKINNIFDSNPNEDLEQEIANQFTFFFEKYIKTEHSSKRYNDYVDRFYESDFKISFEYRVRQLAEEIAKWRQELTSTKEREAKYLRKAFGELLDYFVVRYCQDLNEVHLPESILKYQNIAPEDINLSNMVFDYLDFEKEEEPFYVDFLKMPIKKLKNASKFFLYPEKDEKILFICDQSILRNCREGFAMTEKAIYWKMPFENAQRVYYRNIEEVKRESDWITINEMFFNVSKTLNIKVLKLLKKLKELEIE